MMEEQKAELLSEAKKEAGVEYQKIVKEADEQAKQIVEHAKDEALVEKAKILREAQEDISNLILDAAGKVAGLKSNAQDHPGDSDLFDQFLDKAGDSIE